MMKLNDNVYHTIIDLYCQKIINAIEIESDPIVKKRIENQLIEFDRKLNDLRELCNNDM